MNAMIAANPRRELAFATLSLVLTLALYAVFGDWILHKVYDSYFFPNPGPFYGGVLYIGALIIVAYAAVLYHVCLIGHYIRQLREPVPPIDEVEAVFDQPAPTVTVLVPSYKEERLVIWQTLMSAALSQYPAKRVVLLIDNPPNPSAADDRLQLEQTRALPQQMQAQFAAQAAIYREARDRYLARLQLGTSDPLAEARELADLYDQVGAWLDAEIAQCTQGVPLEQLSFDLRFFVQAILQKPATLHRERAMQLRTVKEISPERVKRHYGHLAGLFQVEFTSFERKSYSNLSHDANKAMNLNSYIMLIGKSWKEVPGEQGVALVECPPQEATFTVPPTHYVNTIDADSLMTHDYIARLVYFLEQPQHARVAVAQAPCSSIPGSPVAIERVAGACIDIQFHTHQGYTYWDASFWVGANAMLRMTALDAIKEVQVLGDKITAIYIQDRTVIEDTESTIDLVHKGWKLYNYPMRMTYSATPADFGSLLIQRRRWANGGLIILPKLLRYTFSARKNLRLAKEFFMRFNYLAMTTLSVAVMMLFIFYNFSPRLSSPLLFYANLPLVLLLARDLKVCGYRYSDVLRVAALNLMLLPIVTVGVLKQMQQILTGRKIPFGRTPKVKNRTGAPALYYLLELGMFGYSVYMLYDYALEQEWSKVAYAGVNMLLLGYAIIRFIGIRPMAEDLWNSTRSVLGMRSRKAVVVATGSGLTAG